MSSTLQHCEFLLLRYVPDVVRGEFVNIGLVLLENSSGAGAHVKFTSDWRRVRCLDPGADVEMLQSLTADLSSQLANGAVNREILLAKLQDYCSNGIQITPPTACLTRDVEAELDVLGRMYLQRRRIGRAESAGRQAIVGEMKRVFAQAGVWPLMRKKIAAAEYTYKGDPLKIDCGYRPNGVIRMFHAAPLETDTDAAKVLAFSYPELRDGIMRAENAKAELTAVVEPTLDRAEETILFAMAVLERGGVGVATTADLPRLAETARVELRV